MFPNTHYAPASTAQFARGSAVACAIAHQLWQPVSAVGAGFPPMKRAAVPEAAIYEYGEARLLKYKIGFAGQRKVPTPSGDAVLAQDHCKPQFGVAIATRTNRRHDQRPLRFGKHIAHSRNEAAGLERVDSQVSGAFSLSPGRDASARSGAGLKTFQTPENQGSGGKGSRTPDLFIANEALYQLSYTPVPDLSAQ